MAVTFPLDGVLRFIHNVDRGLGLWVLRQESDGTHVIESYDAVATGRAQPTDQELTDANNDVTVINGQTYSQWLAEHGGDPALTLRRKAKEALDAQADLNTTVRAALIEIIEYAVQTAANLNALLDGIDSAVNLAQIKAAAALIDNQPTPTLAQARNAIKARIDNGEADT